MQRWYVYYIHEDGDHMVLAEEWDDEPDLSQPPCGARFTPLHKVTESNQPLWFPTQEQAENWIDFDQPIWIGKNHPGRLQVAQWRRNHGPGPTKGDARESGT